MNHIFLYDLVFFNIWQCDLILSAKNAHAKLAFCVHKIIQISTEILFYSAIIKERIYILSKATTSLALKLTYKNDLNKEEKYKILVKSSHKLFHKNISYK